MTRPPSPISMLLSQHTRRREFLTGLLIASALSSSKAVAQQTTRVYRVGVLEPLPEARNTANLSAFRRELRAAGFEEGRNLSIEYRSADGRADRFAKLASELTALNLDLIVTRGTPAAWAAKNATAVIPLLMSTMGDPRAFVASFAQPGGNITGVVTFSTELTGKRIELLNSLAPNSARIALLHNMGNPAVPAEWEETKIAAKALGLEAHLVDVRSESDIRGALDELRARDVHALIVGADGIIQMHQDTIIQTAARSRLPAIYPAREFVEAGGLMAYAVSYPELYARLAVLAAKILKGAKPGDLPVEQPTKFELVVNAKTANALGITIPPTLLARADEVIE